jgi:hypothetical protein
MSNSSSSNINFDCKISSLNNNNILITDKKTNETLEVDLPEVIIQIRINPNEENQDILYCLSKEKVYEINLTEVFID